MWELLVNLFWLDAVVILAGVTLIYASMQKHRVPAMTPLDDRSVNGAPPEPLNRFEAEVQEMGFQYCGDYGFGGSDAVEMILQGYLSNDRLHCMVIMHVKAEFEAFTAIEFSTELTPFGNITTNNNRQVGIFRYPLHKTLTKAPWKKSARDVYDLHLSLVEIANANGYQAKCIDPSRFAEEVRNDSIRDFESQERRGVLTRTATDTYRLSLWGAIRSVPRVWGQIAYGALFFLYRRSDQAFHRTLQRRFGKIRATRYTPD